MKAGSREQVRRRHRDDEPGALERALEAADDLVALGGARAARARDRCRAATRRRRRARPASRRSRPDRAPGGSARRTGSRPTLPTVQSPNVNRSLGVGVYELSAVTSFSLWLPSSSARLRVRASPRCRYRLLDAVDQSRARRPRERDASSARARRPTASRARAARGRPTPRSGGARSASALAATGRAREVARDLGRRPAARARRARRGRPAAAPRDALERHPLGARRRSASSSCSAARRRRRRRLGSVPVASFTATSWMWLRRVEPDAGGAGRARAPAARLHDRAALRRRASPTAATPRAPAGGRR